MKNVREQLKETLREKVAFNSSLLNPIIGSATKKIIRTGVSEGVMMAAGRPFEKQDHPSSAVIYVPTPVPESDAPDAPTVIRSIPLSISVTSGLNGSPQINARPVIPAEGVQLQDVS